MSFLKNFSVEKVVGNFLRRNAYTYPDNQVIEVRSEDYVHYDTVQREDPIRLYRLSYENKILYEIVLLKEMKTSFSICRVENEFLSLQYFQSLSNKLPQILMISPNNITCDSLQELFNYIREHLNQTLAHICAHFGYNEYFKQLTANDQQIINARCVDTGVTPLHVAIKANRLSTVQALISLSASLDILDNDNNNALHFAANTNKEIINALCLYAQSTNVDLIKLINSKNRDNFSPLYLSCLNDKSDCVKELLKNGAAVNGASYSEGSQSRDDFNCDLKDKSVIDQLDTKHMKNGGTPLHWARGQQCIEILIENGCAIDARNFQGETVLHIMVTKTNLACIITLLSHNADVNAMGSNGNTPLHLAVKCGDVNIVKALTVFGADVNMQNSGGETARHLAASAKSTPQQSLILYILHSVGAKRCAINRLNCSDGCSLSDASHFNGIPPDNSPFKRIEKLYDEMLGEKLIKETISKLNAKHNNANNMEIDGEEGSRQCRVLCLDGGGIRGLILIQMLWVLEQMINKPIIDCFDFIAGTSTGGILALLLALGRSAHECRQLYFKLKDKVFVGNRPYDAEPLEKFLQNAVGDSSHMSDIKKPKIMVTATLAERFPPHIHFFRNYDSPNDILGNNMKCDTMVANTNPSEQLIWKAARCSGAAPTYFRPWPPFLDGGLISNNPTLDALTEIHKLNKAFEVAGRDSEKHVIGLMVSLGTGSIPIKQMPIIDVYRPDSIYAVAKIAFSASSLGQLLIEQATQADGQVVERAKSWCSMISVPYFRLNPPLSEDVPLDEVNNVRIVNMLWETTAYMYSRKSEIDDLIALLLR